MLTQRQTLSIGVLTPQPLSVIFSNPFFGAFAKAASSRRSPGTAHVYLATRRLARRAVGRATVDGVVAVGLTDDHPEVEQIRRAALLIVFVDSNAQPSTRRSTSTTGRGSGGGRAPHGLGHREFLVIGAEPPPTTRTEPEGVLERRLRGYREALAKVGSTCWPSALSSGPRASRAVRLPSIGRGRTASGPLRCS